MKLYEREFFISRIKAGYIPVSLGQKRFLVYSPNTDTILLANEIYLEEYNRGIEEGLFEDYDIYELLVLNNMWTETDENNLNDIVPKHIEYWKKELYNSVLKSNTRSRIRKYLSAAKDELVKLYNTRHCFDHMTCIGYANYVKNMFIISESTRYKNKKVNWNKIDLNWIMNSYHEKLLDSDKIRVLARTYPWNNLWPNLKTNGRIFDNVDLTTEQQMLISWSSMYDRIYESPDCPPEEVIEDDDMLDGWLLIQKEKRDKERKKQEVESATNSKINNADDIFIMAETFEDAKKISLLNDARGNRVKQQRLSQIKKEGVVPEQRLTDVKRKQQMLAHQAYVQQSKGR